MEAHGMKGQGLKDMGSELASRSTAQLFALVVGVIVTLAGIATMVVNPGFASGDAIVTERLLMMDVNGWSGLLLLLTGVALLVGSRKPVGARRTCLVVGVIYLIVTVWSLFTATVLGVLPINDMTAILYAAIGVLGVTAGVGPDPRDKSS